VVVVVVELFTANETDVIQRVVGGGGVGYVGYIVGLREKEAVSYRAIYDRYGQTPSFK
jgi:hypothetical protein